MAFKSYEEAVGPIVLAYRGKEYILPTLTMEQGLDVHARADTINAGELFKVFMGDAGDRMLDDKVPPAIVDRALWTAVADWKNGREAAEEVWNNGIPKALLETIRTTVMGELAAMASTTPPPASGSSTTSPSKPKGRRGKGSSTVGA